MFVFCSIINPPAEPLLIEPPDAEGYAFLDICCEYIHFHIGLVSRHPVGESTGSTYRLSVVNSILMMRAKIRSMERSPIAIVYAKHPEFSFTKLEKAFKEFGEGDPRVSKWAVQEPLGLPPLQVADLVAYEISRRHRAALRRRYPWQRLRDSSGILIFTEEEAPPSSEGQPF